MKANAVRLQRSCFYRSVLTRLLLALTDGPAAAKNSPLGTQYLAPQRT